MAPLQEEQKLFRASVREFVQGEIVPRIEDWELRGALSKELFQKCGEMGLLGVRFSPKWGGQGLDFWFTTILVEELVKSGSVGVCVSLMAHCEFSSAVIELYGSDRLKEEFLAPAIRGEKIAALGLTEPGAGSDLTALSTKAVKRGREYIISGQKTFITNGSIGDFLTAAVRTGAEGGKGISLIVIPTDSKGYRAQRLKKIGAHATDTAEVYLDDVVVPEEYLIGRENSGLSYIINGFTAERLILSIICYSQMENMFEEALKYAKERRCFGKKLIEFQTWRHRLADVRADIEAAKALTHTAVDKFVRGEPAGVAACMAKLFATEKMPQISHITRQIFGGYGYMEESKIAGLALDSMGFSVGARHFGNNVRNDCEGDGQRMTQRVAIVGVGQTDYRVQPDLNIPEMVYLAVTKALKDSQLSIGEIDYIVTASGDLWDGKVASNLAITEVVGAVMKGETRVASDGIFAFFHGWMCILSGYYKTCLIVAHCKMSKSSPFPLTNWVFDPIYQQPLGLDYLIAAGLQANSYMTKYKIAEEDCARVVVKNRKQGQCNPRDGPKERPISLWMRIWKRN